MAMIKLRRKYRHGQYKGIQRRKSDDQPGKAVTTGTKKLSGKTVPNKQLRKPQQPDGLPRGECFTKDKKHLLPWCQCGGHHGQQIPDTPFKGGK